MQGEEALEKERGPLNIVDQPLHQLRLLEKQ